MAAADLRSSGEFGGSGGGDRGQRSRRRRGGRRDQPHLLRCLRRLRLSCQPFLLCAFLLLLRLHSVSCFPRVPSDAGHMTANAGDNIVFNCDVHFPGDQPVPYVVQWWKKGKDLPIYIWYDNYPTHADRDYAGRVSKIEPGPNSVFIEPNYGLASLNITNVTEGDRGWYNCRVLFLNRDPDTVSNGTWYHLDVHAPPYFIDTPTEITYVTLAESIILTCQAGGTPTPEIVWFKGEGHVKISLRVGVFNDGTELRINKIRDRDLGEYTCIARNGVGKEGKNMIHFTTRVVLAGGAVITKKPSNLTVQEGQEAEFTCEGQANPGNVSVRWYKDGRAISDLEDLDRRTAVRRNGSLVFSKVESGDAGRYTCNVTNGIGSPTDASAFLAVEYPARVSFHPDVQYIPRGLQGVIRCHIKANPPIQYVTWTKNKRIFEAFEEKGIMAIENGSIIIDRVGPEHVGDYVCTPFNIHGSAGSSKVMHVKMKNPPEITRRPDQEYHRSVGDKVTLPCGAIGSPNPALTWRRVDGRRLPRGRYSLYNGELTLENLRKSDHGVYECVVSSDVATLVARTELFVERTTPHAPTNVTVTDSETFAVTIEWMPGYSGCASCKQTYKIRYREKDSKFPNWIELPVNPPDARKIQIHHLSSRTRYEFQVIGTNEYGDGMYSEIIEAQTKADGGLEWSVYPPTASPSEQSTSTDCIEFNLEITGVAAPQEGPDPNDPDYLSVFDIKLLPRDSLGNVIYPKVPKERDTPPGEAPSPATNLTVQPVAGGWVLRWLGDLSDPRLLYYTAEIKGMKDKDKWMPLTDQKIDKEEASYLIKNMGTGKAYFFRVLAHSAETFSISEKVKYELPDNFKKRAVTAGLTGGILFFIVAIVLSVCTVKICNKRRRRKQERAYTMVACRLSEARNGGHVSQVPLKRPGKNRVPAMRTSSSKFLLHPVFAQASHCVQGLQRRLTLLSATEDQDGEEPDYGDSRRRHSRLPPPKPRAAGGRPGYSVHVEYPTQPGHRGLISRSKDGKFILEEDPEEDDGGFGVQLPPNRFRTRGVALISGFTPERLYSNMPPGGAFVVEGGVYKVGADREWERPEPIYWRQVVYGARGASSDGSGTLPRPPYPYVPSRQPPPQMGSRQVGRLGDEDLRRLRALREQPPSSASLDLLGFSQSRLIRTSNLELLRPETAAKLRSSSPLNQGGLLQAAENWTSPIMGQNNSDLSSISHRERSLPSTLLTTNPTGSSLTAAESSRSLRTAQRSAELHTIHEHPPDDDEAPPAYATTQADVHLRLPIGARSSRLSQQEDPYFQRPTYLNADVMFPNYALNYPAPIHSRGGGTISPSRQYPPLQVPPRSYWQSLYVQPDPADYLQPRMAGSAVPRSPTHEYENTRYLRRMPRAAPAAPLPVPKSSRSPEAVTGQRGIPRGQPGHPGDQGSLVSEVLDAEVTALTNSSSPGSAPGSEKDGAKPYDQHRLQEVMGQVGEKLKPTEDSSSSGIASKNASQHQTSSSSSQSGASQQQFLSPDSKAPLEPIFETHQQPFYENWPVSQPSVRPKLSSPTASSTFHGYHYMQPLSIVPPGEEDDASLVMLPPLTPHQTMGLSAKPQATRGLDRRLEASSSTPIADTASLLGTPPSRLDTPTRPGSAHSAPMLDVSIDRHYEFDPRTPTEEDQDLDPRAIREALPRQWHRPYLGYNPRVRERELGRAAQLARGERVFSDSEIYSPVFPRGRPREESGASGRAEDEMSARVRAMKKEFQEYRVQQQREQSQQRQLEQQEAASATASKSPSTSPTTTISTKAAEATKTEKLESLI